MSKNETITEYGTGIVYLRDLNEKIKSGEIDDVIHFSETLMANNIDDIADDITAKRKRIVLVAGPSASGKTSFTKRLCMNLWINGRKPIYLGTDDYFIARDKIKLEADGTKNFENLNALDLDLFNKQLTALLNGEAVDIPRYDFMTGKPVFGERPTKAYEQQIIVVEGIHGLNPELTKDIDEESKYRIYIAPMTEAKIDETRKIQTSDVRKIRRIVRDNSHRGWDPEATLSSWEKVRNGEYENILPYRDNADCHFDSSLVYELAALKKHAAPLLKAVSKDSIYYNEAQRVLELLTHVDELPQERCIPNNSILREFIGGSTIVD